MELAIRQRPSAVTVIGWIFLVAGALMILMGLQGIIIYSIVKPLATRAPQSLEQAKPLIWPFLLIGRYLGLLAILKILAGVIILITSIQFLKLRPWARVVLELCSWLGALIVIVFGTFLTIAWIATTTSLWRAGAELPGFIVVFVGIGALMASINVAVFVVPFAALIVFLRGKTVREAFKPAHTPVNPQES